MEEDGEHGEWGHTVGSGKEGWAGTGLHHGELSLPSRKRGQGTNNMDTACGTTTGM